MEGKFNGVGYDQKRYYYWKKVHDVPAGGRSELIGSSFNDLSQLGIELAKPNYSDQIPPFTVTLTALNEYGNVTVMHILGVELINEGSGVSIDDIVTETQMTFVARAILGWRPLQIPNGSESYNINQNDIVERLNALTAVQQAQALQNIEALG
jgi:hypothetical protein